MIPEGVRDPRSFGDAKEVNCFCCYVGKSGGLERCLHTCLMRSVCTHHLACAINAGNLGNAIHALIHATCRAVAPLEFSDSRVPTSTLALLRRMQICIAFS